MCTEAHIICHLPKVEKTAFADLAYARRVSVSRLMRALVGKELMEARRHAKRKGGTAR